MGYNTVAVIYNDFTGELERDAGRYGPRIAEAMSALSYPREHQGHRTNFGAGVAICHAHADAEQVVVVSRNSGQRISEATDLGWVALDTMRECLERHGYKVTKRRKPKAEALSPTPPLGGE